MRSRDSSGDSSRVDLGGRLRGARERRGMTLRELARRVGVSASLISQIETSKAQPSVRTLYDIVSELGISFDSLFGDAERGDWDAAHVIRSVGHHPEIPPVQRATDRRGVEFAQGVRWESLTAIPVPGIEFLYIEYQPGSESGPPDNPQTHPGREWGYVISGTLHVSVVGDEYVLGPGDAITFPCRLPHRLWNPGDEIVRGIWFVLGETPPKPSTNGEDEAN